MTKKVAIKLEGIHKSFVRNAVLRGINLEIMAGEVTVLMGANGAGKSTLVKIIGGVHGADAGRMELGGVPYSPGTPAQAIRSGVVTVHQSINDGIIPDLDVATNLVLDRLVEGSSHIFNPSSARKAAAGIAARMGLQLDLSATARNLPLADRQLVAIARAMAHEPKVMILDEPTSSLSAAEARRLFTLIDRLRDHGVAVLYISHRMSDIRRIADRVVSLRDGAITGVFEEKPLDLEGAVNAMLGRRMSEIHFDSPAPGAEALRLDNLQIKPNARPFSLTLRRNEVVAVTGLVGVGKSVLGETLFGLKAPVSGSMALDGKAYRPRNARDALEAGVFLVPKDRAANAVVRDFDIARNMSLPFLPRLSKFSVISRRAEQASARRQITSLGIVCQGTGDAIGTLSGGNQQKVVVARWLTEPSHLLILDEPFQGVDIAARRDIGRRLRDTAGERGTLIFVSELDEALEVADRILVMAEHTIVGEHVTANIDIDLVMAQIAGQTVKTDRQQAPAAALAS